MKTNDNAKEVFFFVNKQGEIPYSVQKVFTDKKKALRLLADFVQYDGKDWELDSATFDFVGKHLSQVRVYYGFDYGAGSIFDVEQLSPLFPSVEKAKESDLWQKQYQQAKEDQQKYNISNLKIASKDVFGEDFIYGDVMAGKFYMEIRRFKVDKSV